jgi:preprotein translocase subunit Sec61beta
MNRKMLKTYGVLKGYNIVIDKQGIIRFIDEGDSAVDPNTALTLCTTMHKKVSAK